MSPQYDGNNFEGMAAKSVPERGPGRHSDAWPVPLDRSLIDEDEERQAARMARLRQVWQEMGWIYDEVLWCWRWADDLLSDEERECVARAREACVLEEASRG